MAFEDGNNAYIYFGPLLKRYLIDQNIFGKALQALAHLQKRPDFPFLETEVSDAIGMLLGRPLADIARSLSWVSANDLYWPSSNEVDTAEWGEQEAYRDLVKAANPVQLDAFRRELTVFSTLVKPVIAELYDPDNALLDEPLGLAQVRARWGKQLVTVRMIRMDGKQFELRMTRSDLDFLRETIAKIAKDGDDN